MALDFFLLWGDEPTELQKHWIIRDFDGELLFAYPRNGLVPKDRAITVTQAQIDDVLAEYSDQEHTRGLELVFCREIEVFLEQISLTREIRVSCMGFHNNNSVIAVCGEEDLNYLRFRGCVFHAPPRRNKHYTPEESRDDPEVIDSAATDPTRRL